MSSAESQSGHGPGRTTRDPLTGVFVAMQDAWLAGIATLEGAGRRPTTAEEAGHSATGGEAVSMAAELAVPVGRAMMIGLGRSVSYWLSLAQILATHQARSIRAVTAPASDGSAESQSLAITEEVRAVLREVGDLTTRQARILQSEFDALSESLAQSLQQPDPSAPHRRRWRAKI
jgi:hypothetical protein